MQSPRETLMPAIRFQTCMGPSGWLRQLEITLVRLPSLPNVWRRTLRAQWDPLLRQITIFESVDLNPTQRVGLLLHELVHVLEPHQSESAVVAASNSWLAKFSEDQIDAWNAEMLHLAPLHERDDRKALLDGKRL